MYCRKCGKEIPDAATFCAYCGEEQVKVSASEVPSVKSPKSSGRDEGYLPWAIAGTGIILVISIVVGLVWLSRLNAMNADYLKAVEKHDKLLADTNYALADLHSAVKNLGNLPVDTGNLPVDTGHALADLHAVRAEIRAAVIFSGDTEKVRAQDVLVKQYLKDFEDWLAYLDEFFTDEDSRTFFVEVMDVYSTTLLPAIDKIMEDAAAGTPQAELVAFMTSNIEHSIDKIMDDIEEAMEIE